MGRATDAQFAGDDAQLNCVDLPDDQALPVLARLLAQEGVWQVLRYVLLWRATLLLYPPAKAAGIVKVNLAVRLLVSLRKDQPDQTSPLLQRLQAPLPA
jgi:NAD-dependent oxidoreductase involved in siderophore biosynthesis